MRLVHSLFLIALLGSQYCLGQSNCQSLAKTDLEVVFCKISVTPEGRGLPSFSDFRRNSAQIQTLLLKRPAERLGISLPTPSRSPKKVVASPKPKVNKRPATAATASPPTTKTISPPPSAEVASKGINHCDFRGSSIVCAGDLFRLTLNRQNNQLKPGVLGGANTLDLPPFKQQLTDNIAVNNYLATSYERYIDKMLLVGLGGSTMTYTKFHYTFWELMDKQEDFAARVGAMYEFIKKDKASMAVKTRYGNDMPQGIDWCADLSNDVIVCDNGKKNWVYVRQL